MKSILSQKKIDRLDEIADECGLELHLPPLGTKPYPFFVVNGNFDLGPVVRNLATSKFNYSITSLDKKTYILIKG